jgi:dethiobiotin synthetase
VNLGTILKAFREMSRRYKFLIVEGIGGVLVPLNEEITVLDLMEDLGLPALVVARPTLGTINHTLLTLKALQSRNIRILGFVTSGLEPGEGGITEIQSPGLIARISGVPFLGPVRPLPLSPPLYQHQDLPQCFPWVSTAMLGAL